MKAIKLDERRRAILASAGHILIEGGPGCGKTTIALLKAARCCAILKPEQRILFLSFSRAAVRQVTDRMKTTLSSTQRAILEVRTFHSYFLDLIRSHGRLLTGEQARFITPEREAILRADFMGDDDAWKAEKYRLATEKSLYVFDTLAPALADLLERSSDLRNLYSTRYPVIVVDEFQDTSTDQWRVVQALSATSTIICLADPDQRIFDHIEGVDEHRLEEAKKVLQPEIFDLSSDNHRSPASGILEYANAILRNTPTASPPNVKSYTYSRYTKPELVTHLLVQRTLTKLASHLDTPPTVAVLTRVNAFAGRISEGLTREEELGGEQLAPIDHILYWEPELAAASALVVASILEWPTLPAKDAVVSTLECIADYYRVKLGLGTSGARSKIVTIERAIKAISEDKNTASKTAKVLLEAVKAPPLLTGRSVTDWQVARAVLKGSSELNELAAKVRLVRMLNATGAVAWALSDTWNGATAYIGAVNAVRTALAAEAVDVQQPDKAPVHVMTMHKSKGKEFDAVVIVEGRHDMPLLDPVPGSKTQDADRRLLRVAITRSRHLVIMIRPTTAFPLTPPAQT
ncbi:ATP-dependent helicase [Nocardiopsis alba]|uniref:ATP-dependent helicase n=1 Tax=Nocardiopsis alba TaxID=53437 RepID=UPI0033E379FF